MKTQTKALIASLIVVALGLSAVSGVTYSWWSDSENAQVTITTGHMNLDVDLGDPFVVGDGEPSNPSDITISDLSGSGTSPMTFAITGWVAAPGDVMTIPINWVKIDSNIRTQYTESYSIASSGVDLSAYVSITPSGKVGSTFGSSDGTTDIFGESDKRTIEIKILPTLPATLQNKTFTVTLEFAIYQASAPDIPSGATGTTSSSIKVMNGVPVHAGVINHDSAASAASVSFVGDSGNEGTYAVDSVTPSDVTSEGYTIFEGEILGGISVKCVTDSTKKLTGTSVMVNFVIDRQVQKGNLSIYHNGNEFQINWKNTLGDVVNDKDGYLDYDGSVTVVSFITKQGFSMYYAADTSLITIDTADELFEFANEVNVNKKSYVGKTVMLMSDIDLSGRPWTPVGQTSGCYFNGTFDGNGKTIKNMMIKTGTGMQEAYATGFFGWVGGTVKNLTLQNADVCGQHFVGAIAGSLEYGAIESCEVLDSVITNEHETEDRCGDKVGGIVGIKQPNDNKVNGNVVKGTTISGCRDVGGVAGIAYNPGEFKSNVVRGCEVIVSTSDKSGKAAYCGELVGQKGVGFNLDGSNISSGVEVVYLINSMEKLNEMITGWGTRGSDLEDVTLRLSENLEYTGSDLWTVGILDSDKNGISYLANNSNTLTIDGDGKAIKGLNNALIPGIYNCGKVVVMNLTLKDSTVSVEGCSDPILSSYAAGAVVNSLSESNFEVMNVTVSDARVTAHDWKITGSDGTVVHGTSAAGGIIGYFANSLNYEVKMTSVTVDDTEVQSYKGAGGVVGYCSGNLNIEGCVLSGNEIYSERSDSDFETGVVLGKTSGGGTKTISFDGTKLANNTLKKATTTTIVASGDKCIYGTMYDGPIKINGQDKSDQNTASYPEGNSEFI